MWGQVFIPLLWFQMANVQSGGTQPLQINPNGMICKAKHAGETCNRVLFHYNKFDRAWRCECTSKRTPEDLAARGVTDFVLFEE